MTTDYSKALAFLGHSEWICGETYDSIRFLNDTEVPSEEALDIAYQEYLVQFTYKSQRKGAYPSIADQLDAIYWDQKLGTNVWAESIDKIKSQFPKP